MKIFYNELRNEMLNIVRFMKQPLIINKKNNPFVILMIGVNGSGKTTTTGKLAYHYGLQDKRVMLAAGDLHRPGAIDQLKILGNRSGCASFISNDAASDSASVVFDAVQSVHSQMMDILIIDTAGRLQNKKSGMQELKKIIRVMRKINSDLPHETILVLDANIGQNSIDQVCMFSETVTITGIIMTKLDGSAKGGVLLSIADRFTIPVHYIGIGQNIEDLQEFHPCHFIESIFRKTPNFS